MPNNYNFCGNCPYINQLHLPAKYHSQIGSPLSIDYGNNATELLIFQAPGIDEWQGSTISGRRIPIDSNNSHSAAQRMRNSMQRKGTSRCNYDITEVVQCYPGKNKKGNRDKVPCLDSRLHCLQYLLVESLLLKRYDRIVAFGRIAYEMAVLAVNCASQLGFYQPDPTYARHPSSGVSNATLDNSY